MPAAFSMWGNMGNQAYAVPMVALTPPDPATQGFVLAWNTAAGAVDFAPITWEPASSDFTSAGNFGIAAGKTYKVNAIQVVGARKTGWAAATGTATRTTFDTATVTLPQLAERVKALLDDLTTHGLIGV